MNILNPYSVKLENLSLKDLEYQMKFWEQKSKELAAQGKKLSQEELLWLTSLSVEALKKTSEGTAEAWEGVSSIYDEVAKNYESAEKSWKKAYKDRNIEKWALGVAAASIMIVIAKSQKNRY